MKFITLVPSTIKLEKELISKKLKENEWKVIDDNYQYSVEAVEHMEIKQRWVVVHSKAARGRAEKTVAKQVERAKVQLDKSLYHLQAQRFACETDAQQALESVSKKLKYHCITDIKLTEHKVYEGKGRPKKGAEVKHLEWQISGSYEERGDAVEYSVDQKSCFVLATNVDEVTLSAESVLTHYKAQSSVEHGFRFLKDPLFFVSSLFIKKPSRIDALLMVMTLSLLVSDIDQSKY